ncbi:TSUP family transporter [bacterium]|nr:TSUP family transporter [bacterium]
MKRWPLLTLTALLLLVTVAAVNAQPPKPEPEPNRDAMVGSEAEILPDEPELIGTDLGLPGKLGAAISNTPKGTEPGQIDPDAEPGFANIPGAPQVSYLTAALWAIVVGLLFSTLGAFGGVMAGLGHFTVFGLGDYAKAFNTTNPALSRLLTDSIRVSNQFLVATSALISSFNYWRKGQLVMPLTLTLGLGSVAGAFLVPFLTAGRVDLSTYIGWFGVITLVIALFLLWYMTPFGRRGQNKAKKAAKEFQAAVRAKGERAEHGVKLKKFGLGKATFSFYGVDFSFSPILTFLGGLVITGISAFLGIGGGFLLVPFMTALVGLPMFIVAGTSALSVLIGMIVSIATFVFVGGTVIDWTLIGVEMAGVFVGSLIGPRLLRFIPEKILRLIFVLLAIYLGLSYLSLGFSGNSWLPMI